MKKKHLPQKQKEKKKKVFGKRESGRVVGVFFGYTFLDMEDIDHLNFTLLPPLRAIRYVDDARKKKKKKKKKPSLSFVFPRHEHFLRKHDGFSR